MWKNQFSWTNLLLTNFEKPNAYGHGTPRDDTFTDTLNLINTPMDSCIQQMICGFFNDASMSTLSFILAMPKLVIPSTSPCKPRSQNKENNHHSLHPEHNNISQTSWLPKPQSLPLTAISFPWKFGTTSM
jgi:hypothetical protein